VSTRFYRANGEPWELLEWVGSDARGHPAESFSGGCVELAEKHPRTDGNMADIRPGGYGSPTVVAGSSAGGGQPAVCLGHVWPASGGRPRLLTT